MEHKVWHEVFVEPHNVEQTDTLISLIQLSGNYTMLEADGGFFFAMPEHEDAANFMEKFRKDYPGIEFDYSVTDIPDENWNEIWELSFEPVKIHTKNQGDHAFCSIRATFHNPVPAEHQIIINPSMSFGTGHHETTWLMVKGMQQLQFRGKKVLDFGTGTGILAILAHKLGARHVMAIDHDYKAVTNASENFSINQTSDIKLIQGEIAAADGENFDIILANIQKNVIVNALPLLYKTLNVGGSMLVSGILVNDGEELASLAARQGFMVGELWRKNKWIAALFNKTLL